MRPLLARRRFGLLRRRAKVRSSSRLFYVTILLGIWGIGSLIVPVGCKDSVSTWSAEAKSPDGLWLATAKTQQWGGPGTAYDATTVSLKQVGTSRPATQVLLFSHQYATMNLSMQWLTPKHLQVRYGPSTQPNDRVNLEFHVAKTSGVDVSVEEMANGLDNATR